MELATELSTRQEESCLRTAISRSYYYAYHLARERILRNGFTIVRGGDTHRQVWEKFDASPDGNCKKLYSLALMLKDKRQQADYEALFPRIKDEFPAVLSLAQRFAEGLARLDPRLPRNTGVIL